MTATHATPQAAHPPTSTATPVWLLALTLAAFATGTDDMVIAGLLPELSADLGVSVASAGQLVTLYSLTYGLGAPLLAVVTIPLARRRLLFAATGAFVVVNILMAIAPDYPTLLVLRVIAAASAALIVPTALAVVATSAPAERRGRWLSMVTAGVTLALIAGVPVGTWIATLLEWRATFLFVAALGALAMIGMRRLPATNPDHAESIRSRLAPLRRPAILMASIAFMIAGSGGMMGYIYLGPTMQFLSGGGTSALGLLILIFGIAGFAGVLLGGRATDRIGPVRTLALGVGEATAMVAVLAVIANTMAPGSVPFAALAAITAAWAIGIWSVSPPIQAWLLPRSGGAHAAVLALNTSGMYLGFAIGGAVGGVVLGTWGRSALPLASVVLLVLGGATLAGALRIGSR